MRFFTMLAMLFYATLSSAQLITPDRPGGIENELRMIPRPFSQAAWYDSSRSGSGVYFSEVRPGTAGARLTSLAYYTYTPAGDPLWLIAVGGLSTPTSADIFAGRFGGFDLQLQESRGGPCPNCPVTPNSVTNSSWGRIQIDFSSPYSANLRVGGIETGTIRASDLNLGNSIANLLKGEWRGTERGRRFLSPPGPILETECAVTIGDGTNPAPGNVWLRESALVQVPAADAQWLNITANEACPTLGFFREFRPSIAVASDGKALMHQLSEANARAIFQNSGIPGVNGPLLGFELKADGIVTEFWLQDYNTLIAWTRHQVDTRRVANEIILRRVNPI